MHVSTAADAHPAADVAPMVVVRKLASPEELVHIVLSYTERSHT